MSAIDSTPDYDVAIVGGGPAGLSAAVVLGRSRRRVVLFDHGQPRNYAAQGVHCYLGHDGIGPNSLRELGRNEARQYGAELIDAKVLAARRLAAVGKKLAGFEVQTMGHSFIVRTLLLCTGVVDLLPEIPNLGEFYGRSVHHCPYCDGWEHRDERLVAFGDKTKSVVKLASSLRSWSPHVTACTNGGRPSDEERDALERNGIALRKERVAGLNGIDGRLAEVLFERGQPLKCDALFFSSGQFQQSPLGTQLGVERDEREQLQTGKKQTTGINGLFLAGDADGEVQFAIVAAAEGAVAGVAINEALQEDEQS
jgi:thioredoxin reductase